MSLPSPANAFYPTEQQIEEDLLRTIRLLYLRQGKTVNTAVGSDYQITCKAFARQVWLAFFNNTVALKDLSPLTATGQNLVMLLTVFGVPIRPAIGSSGTLLATFSGTSIVIPANFTITGPNGKKYVATPGFYSTRFIPITSIDTGSGVNVDVGGIFTWDNASIGTLAPTATAYTDIAGGADADSEEQMRSRLLDRLSNPAGGGNWAQIRDWAEGASAAIEQAYPYPAVRGPSTVDVALTSTEADRKVDINTIGLAAAAIRSNVPGDALSINVTTVNPVQLDVIVSAQLSLPVSAGGLGGGWLDAAPWPRDNAQISAVSGPQLDVQTANAPVLGQHIALWNPDAQAMTRLLIASTPTVISGGYRFTVVTEDSTPVPTWIVAGMYVSAGAAAITDYADTFAVAMRTLGPGEKTTNPILLPKSLRRPTPDAGNPSGLTSTMLAQVTAAHPEIGSLDWVARYLTGTTTTATTPAVTATTADPPNIFTLKHFAIRSA